MNTKGMRRGLLAKIHIAKKELGIDDDAYQAALWERFACRNPRRAEQWRAGKPTAKDLSNYELEELVRHFRELGFEPKVPERATRGEPPPAVSWKEALLGKITAQLADQKLPWAYAHGIAQQMFGIDRVHWCDPDQLRKVVAALAYRARRQEGDPA